MSKAPLTTQKYIPTYTFVTSLFLLWGVAISMSDALNRYFQKVLHVSLADSGLVQFSVFGAYGVMGIPAAMFMHRYGYKKGVLMGLVLYALGSFLFVPAADGASFEMFRFALFILACGLATLETVAHPFAAALGDAPTSEQRINFSQAFNAVGSIIGPIIGGYFILRLTPVGDAVKDLQPVKMVYIGIGILILAVAAAFSLVKVPPLNDVHAAEGNGEPAKWGDLFKKRHYVWAVASQFANVAAQGGTWAFFINYLHSYAGISDENAAYWFSASMFCMLAGRVLGTYLMTFFPANRLLAIYTIGIMIATTLTALNLGLVSQIALVSMNFFMSIMFPTIFGLGLRTLGPLTQKGSSFITMGVLGGALFPYFMGKVADQVSIAAAYFLPLLCYTVILLFALKYYKTDQDTN
jgi:FHS family L-fucose permease-like MFS transporter